MALTAEGRAWVSRPAGRRARTIDCDALERLSPRFVPLNQRFKLLITKAQQGGVTSSEHPAWPALLADCTPWTGLPSGRQGCSGAARRLECYARRFEAALRAFEAGDHSMLASPMKDSYHTVWFEYHEELIALTGRDRATEEAAGH